MNLLWTDICFLSLVFFSLICIFLSLRKSHSRECWRRIFQKPLAVASLIIVCLFMLIAILDSIHSKPRDDIATERQVATSLQSLLDKLVAPLGQVYEKTYSAPLALNLYTPELVWVNGKIQEQRSRLDFISSVIENEQEKTFFIITCLTKALSISIGLTFIIGFTGFILKFINNKKGSSTIFFTRKAAWSGLITLFVCIFFMSLCYLLSRGLHVLGTGKIGQDIFYYVIKSIRTGLVIGTLTTLFMLPLAVIMGIAAGYFGGIVDDVIQYIYTTLSSIPGILLITASVLSMQTYIINHPEDFSTLDYSADARLFALCLILGVTSWTSLCRLLRAEALKLREIDYILAARVLGSSVFKIFYKHILPNVMPLILITLVLDFSFLVLAEAVLSYVGVGVSPMTISWGNMINGARLELARTPVVWWPILSAFSFMFILVLAINIFSDALRDIFDPHYS